MEAAEEGDSTRDTLFNIHVCRAWGRRGNGRWRGGEGGLGLTKRVEEGSDVQVQTRQKTSVSVVRDRGQKNNKEVKDCRSQKYRV